MKQAAFMVLAAALCTTGAASAQVGRPTPQAPVRANVQVAPATAADIAALREENRILRERLDRVVEAMQRYANCETDRVTQPAQSSADSVAIAPPASLWCGTQQQNLALLKNID